MITYDILVSCLKTKLSKFTDACDHSRGGKGAGEAFSPLDSNSSTASLPGAIAWSKMPRRQDNEISCGH